MTIRNKYKKDTDLNDLVMVSFLALLALLAYDKDNSPMKMAEALVSASFIILLLVAFLIIFLLLFKSQRGYGGEKVKVVTEDVQIINLYWGQTLKHDLLIYFIPVLILCLPIFSGLEPSFNDFLQATVAYISLVYLKFLYWGRVF